jgi:hypothetical protein
MSTNAAMATVSCATACSTTRASASGRRPPSPCGSGGFAARRRHPSRRGSVRGGGAMPLRLPCLPRERGRERQQAGCSAAQAGARGVRYSRPDLLLDELLDRSNVLVCFAIPIAGRSRST